MDRTAASPAVAVVALTAATVLIAGAVYAVVTPALGPVDLPDAVLEPRLRSGWIHLAHLGGEPAGPVTVRTSVDGVAWDHGPYRLDAGTEVNVSRPALDPAWAVHAEVRFRDRELTDRTIRPGETGGRPADLVVDLTVEPGRLEATVRNVGPSPTPDRRQTIVYFLVDDEDPSGELGWASNRNHTPDPVAPGGAFTRARRYDPADLDAGPHTFEAVVNLDADGDPNLVELDYTNNREHVRR